MIDLKESLNLNLNKILHSMKYYISESRLEILMKKKYDDPIPNKINYIVILNDVKEFWEKNDTKKKEEQHTIQKITVKEFLSFLLSVNKYYTYQTHFINLDFNIDKINKS